MGEKKKIQAKKRALAFCVISCKELVVPPVVHPCSGVVREVQLCCGLGLDSCFAAFFF